MELNKIYQGNSMEILKTFPDNFIDCVVTSPPYYGLRDYGTSKWEGGNAECDHSKKTSDKVSSSTLDSPSTNNNHEREDWRGGICGKCGAKRIDSQIGLEETPEAYILKLVELFAEVKRVLKPEGTLWLNIGDTYAAYWGQKYGQGQSFSGDRENRGSAPPSKKSPEFSDLNIKPKDLFGIPWMLATALRAPSFICHNCKEQNHSLRWGKFPNGRWICPSCNLSKGHDVIPGWYLRQDIIWHKPNPMPESVTDRCTKSHEYIFLLSKSPKYYYDAYAIKTEIKDSTVQRMNQQIENQKGSDRVPNKTNGSMKAVGPGRNPRKGVDVKGRNQGSGKGIPAMELLGNGFKGHSGNFDPDGNLIGDGKANKKSVWTVTTKPFSEAHFATFPEDLIVDCIKAGSSEGGCCSSCRKPFERSVEKEYVDRENYFGEKQKVRHSRGKAGTTYKEIVSSQTIGWEPSCDCQAASPSWLPIILDPFMGAGTTALVSRKLNRNFIGIELNPEYIKIAEQRLKNDLGLFL